MYYVTNYSKIKVNGNKFKTDWFDNTCDVYIIYLALKAFLYDLLGNRVTILAQTFSRWSAGTAYVI